MSLSIGRKLAIVRTAFGLLVATFIGMTIWAFTAAPSAEYTGARSDFIAELPTFDLESSIPSEAAVMAALDDLGVTIDAISADGFGFGYANGVPARLALGGTDVLFVDTLQMDGKAFCDGQGPNGESLLSAWSRLVNYSGAASWTESTLEEGVIVAGPKVDGVNFWEQSGIAATIRYGSSSCYFQVAIPFAGELATGETAQLGSLDAAMSRAESALSSAPNVAEYNYGYLLSGTESVPVWYLNVVKAESQSGETLSEWFAVPAGGTR